MILQPRTVSDELKLWRSLFARIEFSAEDKKYYRNLEKGFEGELIFDQLIANLQCCYIINGLLLELNNSYFQIDSLIITEKTIFLYDVKHYEGDYVFEEGEFRLVTEPNQLKNPLHQLQRCETLFRQFLKKLGFQLPTEANLVFVNPEFTLYQAPLKHPIILPTQLNQLVQKLDRISSNLSKRHKDLGEQLIAAHQTGVPFTKFPPYHFKEMKKGFLCAQDHSLNTYPKEKNLVCAECGHEEGLDAAVVRLVEEMKLLFPDRRITTNDVYTFCGGGVSKKKIYRILIKSFKIIGYGKWAYYE